jgi:phage-related protein
MASSPAPLNLKPLEWVGSSKEDLLAFPVRSRKEAGYALYLAQIGMKAVKAKPLRGFGGAHVLEVVLEREGNAYRAVYTVKFAKAVFVLHAFQKKSKRGIATPAADMEIIRRRLKVAASEYQRLYGSGKHEEETD